MQKLTQKTSYPRVKVLSPVSEHALDPSEEACCICFEPLSSTQLSHGWSEMPVQLPCGHVFGEACILRWTLTNGSCPLCRRDISAIDDLPATRCSLNTSNSNAEESTVSMQDDIWLDCHVWGNRDVDQPPDGTVSIIDSNIVAEVYTSQAFTIFLPDTGLTSSEIQPCADDRGLCDCYGEDTSLRAFSEASLTPPSPMPSSSSVTSDTCGVGSRFANLIFVTSNGWKSITTIRAFLRSSLLDPETNVTQHESW